MLSEGAARPLVGPELIEAALAQVAPGVAGQGQPATVP